MKKRKPKSPRTIIKDFKQLLRVEQDLSQMRYEGIKKLEKQIENLTQEKDEFRKSNALAQATLLKLESLFTGNPEITSSDTHNDFYRDPKPSLEDKIKSVIGRCEYLESQRRDAEESQRQFYTSAEHFKNEATRLRNQLKSIRDNIMKECPVGAE